MLEGYWEHTWEEGHFVFDVYEGGGLFNMEPSTKSASTPAVYRGCLCDRV